MSSHILHEIEAMTSNILLINNGRILAEGDVHRSGISSTSTRTPCTSGRSSRARSRGDFLTRDDVLSLRFEAEAIVVETAKPDDFYRI